MIKIAILVCLAALAAAEPDAFYGPYGYGNSHGYSWPMWYRPGMQQGYSYHSYHYGKRSAEAEPEAEADADAYYRPYGYGYSSGYNWPMNSGYNWNMNNWNNNWNMNSGYNMNNWNNWNNWNRYGMQQGYGSYNYGKRSAEAEPMMYGFYGHPYYMNMNYMNGPYHYYGYF